MRKTFLFPVILLLMVCLAGCGGKNADLKSAMEDALEVIETFCSDMDSAGNADDVVAGLEKFSEGMQKLGPRMAALKEKYPEFKSNQVPEELKELQEKLTSASARMIAAGMKTSGYMNDPKVQAALTKFQNAMMQMQ